MNAPIEALSSGATASVQEAGTGNLREIPYNYTSFSDREITLRYLGMEAWQIITDLRSARRTGQSARMLFEVLGDMWVIDRNPFIQEDLLINRKRRQALVGALTHRLQQIRSRANGEARVNTLLAKAGEAVDQFEAELHSAIALRKRVTAAFNGITHKDNVRFDGLSRVSHVTDATDWRVALPFVVLTPDAELEIPALIKTCASLGLTIIPRGGGTGYTGGAIPLHRNTAVINLEKLDAVGEVRLWEGESNESIQSIRAEAGVVTRRVADAAKLHSLAFAVDPTSQDASTIGGNIAMNAGGKKAVLWGTTLDNLLSWRLVDAEGHWIDVVRLNPRPGKIHEQPLVQFKVTRTDATSGKPVAKPKVLEFPGQALRQQGLGKDVTDKFLGGLPGVQKEGCDGLITSAVLMLHNMPNHVRTVCMEFYGKDLREAVLGILEVKDLVDGTDGVLLAGLEHLDDRYIKAVSYSPKAARGELPKMLLMADIVSDDEDLIGRVASAMVQRVNARNAEGFVAVSVQAREQFWAARSRTAAIAAHTNAFKINEDVVIPLDRLGDYSEGIERINIEHSLKNKCAMINAVQALLQDPSTLSLIGNIADSESEESIDIVKHRLSAAIEELTEVQRSWYSMLDALTHTEKEFLASLGANKQELGDGLNVEAEVQQDIVKSLLHRDTVVSYRNSVEVKLKERFTGNRYERLRAAIDSIHEEWRPRRLFAALHMHAGDGNVHTNIPVFSNDYDMMHEAEQIVDRVMHLAQILNGVISGEHGIGLTKIRYIDDAVLDAFADYKKQVDPHDRFNKGKLSHGSGLADAYTPSLRLVQQEALILEQSELGSLNDSIKDCLRCGKCKPVCTTHAPGANLLYSPRNKVLGTGLIIEAFLYEEQTRRGVSIRHFDEMNDIADHCTVCHKCLSPCPVDIDFGDVSIDMRKILKSQGRKSMNIGTRLSMAFLNVTDPTTIKIMRKGMIEWGFKSQRFANTLASKIPGITKRRSRPGNTTGPVKPVAQVVHFVNRKLPAQSLLPAKTTRALLGIENKQYVPIVRNPTKASEAADAVFYFPGCGSERLFSQVGLATLAMLYDTGSKTVLPPGYLCCGYPQKSSGEITKAKEITTQNRVLFHRVANTLNYLDIKTVIVSCGTCMDQLLTYEFQKIFPECRLLDIHEYLMEKNYSMEGVGGVQYMYHDPCHSPMKTYQPLSVAEKLVGASVELSDRCCGEAGTFAVTRPDIANQVRQRKVKELTQGLQRLGVESGATQHNVKMLTSCPACVQGLSRFADETAIETDYIVVELAKQHFGNNWAETFVAEVNQGGVEQVLL